jgi:hypothetical protein
MARLFLSHSSTDKLFVRKLANDLKVKGHSCWLDEWEIRVGDSIIQKIEKGLDESEYVLLILSERAVASRWVEREWQIKFWDQVKSGKKAVLPCLVEKCDPPKMLSGIKYANFVESYDRGLGEIIDALTPEASPSVKPVVIDEPQFSEEVTALIAKTHAKSSPLSACIADGLTLARRIKNQALERFCRAELQGVHGPKGNVHENDPNIPRWRLVEAFPSKIGQINANNIGFQTESALFEFVKNNPDKFATMRLIWGASVAEIESAAEKVIKTATAMVFTKKYGELQADADEPDLEIPIYVRPHVHHNLLDAIRREFVKNLLACLPSIEDKSS